jgi:hypothetical protein
MKVIIFQPALLVQDIHFFLLNPAWNALSMLPLVYLFENQTVKKQLTEIFSEG